MQELSELYSDLKEIGANVDMIRNFNPTEKQLRDLRDGLLHLRASFLRTSREDQEGALAKA
jgi:hypothetical protein